MPRVWFDKERQSKMPLKSTSTARRYIATGEGQLIVAALAWQKQMLAFFDILLFPYAELCDTTWNITARNSHKRINLLSQVLYRPNLGS